MTSCDSQDSAWRAIDNQTALDDLHTSIAWSDAEVVAFVGAMQAAAQTPVDVSRSGYENWDVRLLLYGAEPHGSHLELFLVDCDAFSADLFRNFTLRGRVDSLKRVEVWDQASRRLLRCSRLLYRFLDLDQIAARSHYGFGEQ